MADIITLGTPTRLDIPPDRVIEAAVGNMKEVVIIGYDNDGNEYFASSVADGADVLWHLERAKKALLEMGD